MSGDNFTELHKLVGQRDKLAYEAVKSGKVSDLAHEDQLHAQAIQEHMHLKHVHKALEFADVREGTPYEIEVGGEVVNPLAHIVTHAAVKSQLEGVPEVRAAFEKMVATGASAHHAEHVLGALLLQYSWEATRGRTGANNLAKAQAHYERSLQKLCRDAAFRKKLTRQFGADHSAFE